MMTSNRSLAAAAVAIALLSPGAAGAGELLAGFKANVGAISTGVRFLNADLTDAGASFATPSLANGLAFGDNGIFADFAADSTLRRYSPAGTPQLNLIGSPDYTPGPLAFGDGALFQAYAFGDTFTVISYTPDFSFGGLYFEVDHPVTGLAFGNDSLFVSYADTLERRDLGGALLESHSFNGIVSSYQLGPLAFGDGALFIGYGRGTAAGDIDYAIGRLDADALTFDSIFDVGDEVRGLAYGDGQLFASFDDKVVSYDPTGVQTNVLVTSIFGLGSRTGALAYRPTVDDCRTRVCGGPGRAVPEPETWALMVLGFGAAGALLRRRRVTVTVPA